MEATVEAHKLRKAVNWTSKLNKRSLALPAASCVALTARHGVLRVQATDLVSVATEVLPDSDADGSDTLWLYASDLKSYLRAVGKTPVTITDNVFSVNGSTVALSQPVKSDEGPKLDVATSGTLAFVSDIAGLKLGDVLRFSSTDDSRPVLTAVQLNMLNGSGIGLAAADGFRLYWSCKDAEVEASGLVPARAIGLVAKQKGTMTVKLGEDRVRFANKTWSVDAQLVEGKYPDLDQVVSDHKYAEATVNTSALTDALKMLVATGRAEYGRSVGIPIKAEVKASEATLSCYESEAKLPVVWQGPAQYAIGFSGPYMLDILSLCGDQTVIQFRSPKEPIRVDAGDATMLLMPMHIK